MALVTFVNDSPPYLNATNLNNNFSELDTKIDNVVDSGSNANGSWIKFVDGTMIQYGEATKTIATTSALTSGGYRSTGFNFDFPIDFYDVPSSVVATDTGDNLDTNGVLVTSISTTKSKFQAVWWSVSSNSTSRSASLSWQAIGRWKA